MVSRSLSTMVRILNRVNSSKSSSVRIVITAHPPWSCGRRRRQGRGRHRLPGPLSGRRLGLWTAMASVVSYGRRWRGCGGVYRPGTRRAHSGCSPRRPVRAQFRPVFLREVEDVVAGHVRLFDHGRRVRQSRDHRMRLRADGLGPGFEPLPASGDFMFLWFSGVCPVRVEY